MSSLNRRIPCSCFAGFPTGLGTIGRTSDGNDLGGLWLRTESSTGVVAFGKNGDDEEGYFNWGDVFNGTRTVTQSGAGLDGTTYQRTETTTLLTQLSLSGDYDTGDYTATWLETAEGGVVESGQRQSFTYSQTSLLRRETELEEEGNLYSGEFELEGLYWHSVTGLEESGATRPGSTGASGTGAVR